MKVLYTSTEFAEHTGIAKSQLLEYDKRGVFQPAYKTDGGHRRYTQEQLQLIQNEHRPENEKRA